MSASAAYRFSDWSSSQRPNASARRWRTGRDARRDGRRLHQRASTPISDSVPDEPGPDQHHHQHERHQDERQRRRGRIVGQLQEAALDHVADHRLARRAEQLGVDEVADRRYEREQRAGHHAGRCERQRHTGEDGPARAVQVVAGLEHARVDALEARIQRQDHERQEVVGDARDHGRRGREQAPVVAQDADRTAARSPPARCPRGSSATTACGSDT